MILNTIVWGAALPIVKPALSYVSPYQFLLYRFLFAALFSLPLLFYYLPKVHQKLKVVGTITVLELVGTTLALAMLYLGLSRTSSIEAGFIASTTPIFITIGGILFLKEKQERKEWLGLSLAVYGTLLLTLEPLILGKLKLDSFSAYGNLLIFAQNIVTAIYFLLAKKKYIGIPKLFITTVSYYVGIVSFFLIVMYTSGSSFFTTMSDISRNMSHPPVAIAVLYMATFGSIIGLTAYIKGQEGMEASEASLFTYLQPLVFIPLSVLWLDEKTNYLMIFAVLVITFGVWLAEYRKKIKFI